MKIKVENAYADGYESTQEHEIDEPTEDELLTWCTPVELSEEFWEDRAYSYTGDGHGAPENNDGRSMDAYYTVTVLECSTYPHLVGESREWG